MSMKLHPRYLLAATAALALCAGAAGATLVQQSQGPREAKPQLMAPSPSFVRPSFADLVEEVSPAVVSIKTEVTVPVRGGFELPQGFEQMLPPGFREEFERRGGNGRHSFRQAVGQGSGFFIDDQGHIVTNNHVIKDADEISVVLNNGAELKAELVGTDPNTDIAVLKVEPSSEQRYVKFSEDTDLRVGDYVLAVGNPFGLGGSVTSGIVSAINRDSNLPYADFIQIDASINRGNSGGPTFDLNGNVVGVNTAIVSPTGVNAGIGLAVPSDIASSVVSQLIESGVVTRGWLGVGIGNIDDLMADALGLDGTDGALVQTVTEDSPAEKAGFLEGDVVLELDGKKVPDANGLTRIVGDIAPGKTVRARIFREGEEKRLSVKLARRDPVEARQANEDETPAPNLSSSTTMDMGAGLSLSNLTDAARARYGLEPDANGVLITDVVPGSEAYDANFRTGMLVTKADNKPVSSVKDIERAIKAAEKRGKEAVLVRVESSQTGGFFLAMPVEADDRG